jgi:hypothetical protein
MPETTGQYRPHARSRSERAKSSPGRAEAVMLDVMKPDGLVLGVGAAAKALGAGSTSSLTTPAGVWSRPPVSTEDTPAYSNKEP